MEKPVQLPVKDVIPYVKPLEDYFGVYDFLLPFAKDAFDENPETKIDFVERVTKEALENQLVKSFPEIDRDVKADLIPILWLMANTYHREMIKENETCFDNYAREDSWWREIKPEILSLYVFLQEHKQCKEVTIKFGKGDENTLKLDNNKHWFHRLMNNQLFPNTIPEVESLQHAKELLHKDPGRPSSREEVNAIAAGIARLFADRGVIEGRAPGKLLEFIRWLLIEMELIDPKDPYDYPVDENWIKSQISAILSSGKDVRFPTIPVEALDKQHLEEYIKRTRPLLWLVVGGNLPD